MALAPGQTLSQYRILSSLGAGGMGEVWRAHDSRLGREVALKVLPEAFAADPERLARFEREAQILASLNHPHIAALHGLEEAGDARALVLELVEGPTLAEALRGGPLPVAEALRIAAQIASALEAAHEQGVVHRDLKPANIKIRPDGAVKVLDFGLAKALEPAAAVAGSESPTLSPGEAATRMGAVLGTASYMAPEQARGRPVDKRADIWAFGCVLYEMLAGRQAFPGDSPSDALVAILSGEPDWSALPAATPAGIDDLLRRCLTKDPRARLRDVGDGRFEIDRAGSRPVATGVREGAGGRRLVVAAAVLGVVAGAALTAWVARGARPAHSDPAPVRFSIELPSEFRSVPFTPRVSPDGRSIAFIASHASEVAGGLWIWRLDQAEARRLSSVGASTHPFWSPDGAWLAFFADGELRRAPVAGGPAETICEAPGANAAWAAGAWSPDDVIVFSTSLGSGLLQVEAAGGAPRPLTELDRSQGERGHVWPRFLPDGRRFAYTVLDAAGPRRSVAVGSLDARGTVARLAADSTPVFTPRGGVAYPRGTAILAQRVRPTTLEPLTDPVVLGSGVSPDQVGGFDAAADTLVYRSAVRRTTLAWYDRSGRLLETVASGPRMREPALSPDGRRVAVELLDESGVSHIWTFDERGAREKRTFGPTRAGDMVWSPRGDRLIFSREFGRGLYELELGSGEERSIDLDATTDGVYANDWSPDGEHLLYTRYDGSTNGDVWMLALSAPGEAVPLVQTAALEHQGRFSPDGRWIAYSSNENEPGRPQVYVRPMPPGVGGWQISTDGGAQPMWRGDGRELFYLDLDGVLHAVPVGAGDAFVEGEPEPLFPLSRSGSPFYGVDNDYAVSPDGERFLVASVDPEDRERLNVVVSWEALLPR